MKQFPLHVLRDYALIADGERGVVIGPRGDIVWLCAPRWHSDAVFGRLIGGDGEGAFLLCGFILALALHQQGDEVGAARWFERTRTACGSPGLFSQEYDVTQRQLRGNLPQAFVHALMLECAVQLPRGRSLDQTRLLREGGTRLMTETVVITGASGGIGRATARLYGQRGANVGLIARGDSGLTGAVADVEEAGGKALAVPTDVAVYTQVEDAARQVEEQFGPIDTWINVAFASVFAPFADIRPDEFRRVTEVSYLGFVHGTMAALARMMPRDRGTIVQVGSALGERSIPLQSAYCGAKHAINGFTSSLRCELLHEHSGVRVTIAQMPAVNTPQFSWVRSKLPRHPQPVPPIYEPEVAARGVLYAAGHPGRRQYWIGATTAATIVANKFVPALLDRYLARTGYDSQQTDQEGAVRGPGNLQRPTDSRDGHDFGAHGIFDSRSHSRSAQVWAVEHPQVTWGLTAAGVIAGAVLAARLAGRR